MSSTALHTTIKEFLIDLARSRHRSQHTIANYRFYLERFVTASGVTSITAIDHTTAERFRQWLDHQTDNRNQPLSTATKNYHLIALRALLNFCAQRGIKTLPAKTVKLKKTASAQPAVAPTALLEQLLEAPLKTDEAKIIQCRDKAILELFFSTGLRVSELAHLTRQTVGLDSRKITVSPSKKNRTVMMSNQAAFWLKQYLSARTDSSAAVFVRHDRAKQKKAVTFLTPRSIQRLVHAYAVAVGIGKNITPQTLRHSFGARLVKKGTDLETVQKTMGHLSPLSTKRYQ